MSLRPIFICLSVEAAGVAGVLWFRSTVVKVDHEEVAARLRKYEGKSDA